MKFEIKLNTLLSAGFPFVVVALFFYSEKYDYQEFKSKMAEWNEVQGKVTIKDCHNHGNYSAEFVVNGQTKGGIPPNPYAKGNCDTIRVGQLIPVWVSKSDDDYFIFESPSSTKKSMLFDHYGVWVAYPFFLFFVLLTGTFQMKNDRVIKFDKWKITIINVVG